MLMQHHKPESCGNFVVVAMFKIKVTARAHYDQNITLSAILSEMLISWQPNLV